MRRTVTPCIGLCAVLFGGCNFLESALELTIGAGQIPRVQQDFTLPSPDRLAGDQLTGVGLPGAPKSLDAMTLAHLRGVLRVEGGGVEERPLDPQGTLRLVDCRPGIPALPCPEGFDGLAIRVSVPINAISEAQANDMKDKMADVSPDAIVQIRIRVFTLDLGYPETPATATAAPEPVADAAEVTLRSVVLDLGMLALSLADAAGNTVQVLDQRFLSSISPATPQRFDVDSSTVFTSALKDAILAGHAVGFNLVLDLAVPVERLYSMALADLTVRMDIQPEIVISVLRAALSKL